MRTTFTDITISFASVTKVTNEFTIQVYCLFYPAPAIPDTPQSYQVMILDEATVTNLEFDFGGESTSSSSTTCPFEYYFAYSDISGSEIIKPSIFTSDFLTYSDPLYTSEINLVPGSHDFYFRAVSPGNWDYPSAMHTVNIYCDASLIIPSVFLTS